jgi:hypothetical protein
MSQRHFTHVSEERRRRFFSASRMPPRIFAPAPVILPTTPFHDDARRLFVCTPAAFLKATFHMVFTRISLAIR